MISDDSDRHMFKAFEDAFFFFNSTLETKHLITDALGNLIVNYVAAFRNVKPLRAIVDDIKSSILRNFTDCDYELDVFLRTIPFSYDYLRKLCFPRPQRLSAS